VVLCASKKGTKGDGTVGTKTRSVYLLLTGRLKGKAAVDGNGKINVLDMDKYLKTNVSNKAKEIGGNRNRPVK